MPDVMLSLTVLQAQQVEAAINARLSRLYRARPRLDPFGREVNETVCRQLESASLLLSLALYDEPESADGITAAKAEAERWSESELRYAHGDR